MTPWTRGSVLQAWLVVDMISGLLFAINFSNPFTWAFTTSHRLLMHYSGVAWLHAEISWTSSQSWSMFVALTSNAREAGGRPLLAIIADGNPDEKNACYCLNCSQQKEIIIQPTVVNVSWRKEEVPLVQPREVSRRFCCWKLGQLLVFMILALNSLHTAVLLLFVLSLTSSLPSCLPSLSS